jgi:hypothetical protein
MRVHFHLPHAHAPRPACTGLSSPCELLDYIPVGARPLYTHLYTEMLQFLERYPDDERRWFMALRAWPALVTAPVRRGGGNATERLLKRLEKWRDWRFEELYDEEGSCKENSREGWNNRGSDGSRGGRR